jgi:Arc/MetJ-type ribon-helix-helix transcriptional regulator
LAKTEIQRSTISWFNGDYWLMNGFLIPHTAQMALCRLIDSGRFKDVDSAIREGIEIVIQENAPRLIRNDRYWLNGLRKIGELCEKAEKAKPDEAGLGNIRLLNRMYRAMEKAMS